MFDELEDEFGRDEEAEEAVVVGREEFDAGEAGFFDVDEWGAGGEDVAEKLGEVGLVADDHDA